MCLLQRGEIELELDLAATNNVVLATEAGGVDDEVPLDNVSCNYFLYVGDKVLFKF